MKLTFKPGLTSTAAVVSTFTREEEYLNSTEILVARNPDGGWTATHTEHGNKVEAGEGPTPEAAMSNLVGNSGELDMNRLGEFTDGITLTPVGETADTDHRSTTIRLDPNGDAEFAITLNRPRGPASAIDVFILPVGDGEYEARSRLVGDFPATIERDGVVTKLPENGILTDFISNKDIEGTLGDTNALYDTDVKYIAVVNG